MSSPTDPIAGNTTSSPIDSGTDSRIDNRRQQLEQWLTEVLGTPVSGESASSDASFRRYFRYQFPDKSVIAMDAPPTTEDCRPFVKVDRLLADAGVTVPEILAEDLERGFLLLSDLGLNTYLDVMLREGFALAEADELFTAAINSLLKFQQASLQGILPEYDEALLRRELQLFPDWYLQQHLQIEITEKISAIIEALFQQLIDQVLSQQKVYVHRDFMPRNLMVMEDRSDRSEGASIGGSLGVGVLDFQDAVYGPISYDPICLFKDAFISWPEEKVEQWLCQYWQQARNVSLPVPESFAEFQRDCDYMGLQRHLKVIGIFARICHRDGKPKYLDDVPRFFNYITVVAARRPELTALQDLLSWLDKQGVGA